MPYFEEWFGKHIADSEKEEACKAAYMAGLHQALQYMEPLLDHACFTTSTCSEPVCQAYHKIADLIA